MTAPPSPSSWPKRSTAANSLGRISRAISEVEGRSPAGARSYQISISVDGEGLQKTGGRVYGLWSIEGAAIGSFAARLEEPPSARPLIFPVEGLPAPASP